MNVGAVVSPRAVLRVAAVVVGLSVAIAAIVAIAVAHDAQLWLGFTFRGVPARWGTAVSIFINNARLTAGIATAALVYQLRWYIAPNERLVRALSTICDAVLFVAVVANAAIVGASLGAYGCRMIISMLPHGPVELAGYCVALSCYLDARRGPIGWRHWAWAIATTALLLAVAALLETFAAFT